MTLSECENGFYRVSNSGITDDREIVLPSVKRVMIHVIKQILKLELKAKQIDQHDRKTERQLQKIETQACRLMKMRKSEDQEDQE